MVNMYVQTRTSSFFSVFFIFLISNVYPYILMASKVEVVIVGKQEADLCGEVCGLQLTYCGMR